MSRSSFLTHKEHSVQLSSRSQIHPTRTLSWAVAVPSVPPFKSPSWISKVQAFLAPDHQLPQSLPACWPLPAEGEVVAGAEHRPGPLTGLSFGRRGRRPRGWGRGVGRWGGPAPGTALPFPTAGCLSQPLRWHACFDSLLRVEGSWPPSPDLPSGWPAGSLGTLCTQAPFPGP